MKHLICLVYPREKNYQIKLLWKMGRAILVLWAAHVSQERVALGWPDQQKSTGIATGVRKFLRVTDRRQSRVSLLQYVSIKGHCLSRSTHWLNFNYQWMDYWVCCGTPPQSSATSHIPVRSTSTCTVHQFWSCTGFLQFILGRVGKASF